MNHNKTQRICLLIFMLVSFMLYLTACVTTQNEAIIQNQPAPDKTSQPVKQKESSGFAFSSGGESTGKVSSEITKSPASEIDFWIEKYPPINPKNDAMAQRTFLIFEKVKSVADKRGSLTPRLSIHDSKGDPWAIALPDGFIVLSKRAVEICYQGVSKEEGDARIAFVVGHELGHMAEDDFWHLETWMSLASDPEGVLLREILGNPEDAAKIKEKEMRADDRGFMYAAIAGYPVHLLTGDGKGKQNFFTYWANQISHKHIDKDHPKPEQRASFLQNRLKRLSDSLDYFKFGVRLAHFRKFEDALYFFREFQKIFSSREVYNNIAYCYLQIAIKEMPVPVAYEYWFPIVMDIRTYAEAMSLKGEKTKISDTARQYIEEAAAYLKKACEADKAYIPARINLACAYYYLDEIYQARAIIEEARSIEPENSDVLCLRALIMLKETPNADMWPLAAKNLEELAQKPESTLSAKYNLAVMLENRGRSGNAQQLWASLAKDSHNIPMPFRSEVLKKSGISDKKASEHLTGKLPWDVPVPVGTDLHKDVLSKEHLNRWNKIPLNWYKKKLTGNIYRNQSSSVLELDSYVEMVVIQGSGTLAGLKSRYGGVWHETPQAGGTLYFCDPQWSVMVQDGVIREIWIVRR